MKNTGEKGYEILRDLGFSDLETKIYIFLLKESPVTGYRVSHGIGKPTANTYKGISSLKEKGAIFVDEGEKRLVRPVPPQELLARLERQYTRQCAEAEELLSSVGEEKPDHRVWQLNSVPQVYERARAMIAAANEIILADVFPSQMMELEGDLEAAAKRGLAVHVIVYEPVRDASFNRVMGVTQINDLSWPGHQLNLVTDGREHLLSMFTKGGCRVHQAIWSNSHFLSCIQHNHLSMEILVKSLSPEDQERLIFGQKIADILLVNANPPGLRRIIETISEENQPKND